MDESPAPRRPDDGRPVRLAAMAFVLSLALMGGALYWATNVAETRAERRYALVPAMIPLAISAGTLRQLIHRQWKARNKRQSEPPSSTAS